MIRKKKIVLCMGSSCFARGNREMVEKIRTYIVKKNLEDKIEFKADHCFDQCVNGPNMMVNGHLYQGITEENIEDYLEEGLAI